MQVSLHQAPPTCCRAAGAEAAAAMRAGASWIHDSGLELCMHAVGKAAYCRGIQRRLALRTSIRCIEGHARLFHKGRHRPEQWAAAAAARPEMCLAHPAPAGWWSSGSGACRKEEGGEQTLV